MLDLPFDPLERSKEVEVLEMEGFAGKYYRFRPCKILWPVLGRRSFKHLYQVLKEVFEANPMADFILETNSLVLGFQPNFVRRISHFKNL